MKIDQRKLEAELARIFRSYGIQTTDFHGVQHIGIAATRATEDGVSVPTLPASQVVSLATLARDIAECMA